MILQSNYLWVQEQFRRGQLEIENGKIVGVLPHGTKPADYDYGDCYLLPGFIDIHTHGHNGVDAAQANPVEIARWQREVAEEGVTSFLATVATQSQADTLKSFSALSALVSKGEGAEMLGIYLEGNFINAAHKGAHDPALIAPPSLEVLKQVFQAAGGKLRLMILAIELDKDHALLDYAVAQGVRVSVGHSGATYSQVLEAMAHGLCSVTHAYNGMVGYLHRETGILGAAMTQPQLYTEIIADGHHVSWPAVEILAKCKDAHHLILVTDASPLKGYRGPLPDNIHIDGQGQFRTPGGNLCSSSLRMCDGIYNLITKANVSFSQAVNAATRNPAAMLGLLDRKGSLAVGKDADVVAVTPKFEVLQTFCRGKAMLKGEKA